MHELDLMLWHVLKLSGRKPENHFVLYGSMCQQGPSPKRSFPLLFPFIRNWNYHLDSSEKVVWTLPPLLAFLCVFGLDKIVSASGFSKESSFDYCSFCLDYLTICSLSEPLFFVFLSWCIYNASLWINSSWKPSIVCERSQIEAVPWVLCTCTGDVWKDQGQEDRWCLQVVFW